MASLNRNALLGLCYATTTLAQGYGPYGGGNGQSAQQAAAAAARSAQAESRAHAAYLIMIHGILMSLAFAFMMPLGATLIRILKMRGTAWIHGAWMTLAYAVALAGFGIGVWFVATRNNLDTAHAVLGIIIIGMLFLQPLGGWLAHRVYLSKGRRNVFSAVHRWNGRVFLTVAGINGGLGIQLHDSGRTWIIAYSVVAAFFFTLWWSVSLFDWFKNRRHAGKISRNEKIRDSEGRGSEAS